MKTKPLPSRISALLAPPNENFLYLCSNNGSGWEVLVMATDTLQTVQTIPLGSRR